MFWPHFQTPIQKQPLKQLPCSWWIVVDVALVNKSMMTILYKACADFLTIISKLSRITGGIDTYICRNIPHIAPQLPLLLAGYYFYRTTVWQATTATAKPEPPQKIVHIPLATKWCNEIKSGRKTVELRAASSHWLPRVQNATHCLFTRGHSANHLYLFHLFTMPLEAILSNPLEAINLRLPSRTNETRKTKNKNNWLSFSTAMWVRLWIKDSHKEKNP